MKEELKNNNSIIRNDYLILLEILPVSMHDFHSRPLIALGM